MIFLFARYRATVSSSFISLISSCFGFEACVLLASTFVALAGYSLMVLESRSLIGWSVAGRRSGGQGPGRWLLGADVASVAVLPAWDRPAA